MLDTALKSHISRGCQTMHGRLANEQITHVYYVSATKRTVTFLENSHVDTVHVTVLHVYLQRALVITS